MSKIISFIDGIRFYVMAGLLALSAVSGAGWYVTNLRLDACQASRLADQESYKRAQAEATAKAEVLKAKKEKEYVEKASEADARYVDLSNEYRAAVLRYQAAKGSSVRADLPRQTETPESSDRSGEEAVIPDEVSVTTGDALICAENTARLEIVQQWWDSIE